MAEITFTCPEARERFDRCKALTEARGDFTLQDCVDRLRQWKHPIRIGRDFDEMSFTFHEVLPADLLAQGLNPVRGGIIYHGRRDGYGSGAGPTFSVTLGETEGYSIHT